MPPCNARTPTLTLAWRGGCGAAAGGFTVEISATDKSISMHLHGGRCERCGTPKQQCIREASIRSVLTGYSWRLFLATPNHTTATIHDSSTAPQNCSSLQRPKSLWHPAPQCADESPLSLVSITFPAGVSATTTYQKPFSEQHVLLPKLRHVAANLAPQRPFVVSPTLGGTLLHVPKSTSQPVPQWPSPEPLHHARPVSIFISFSYLRRFFHKLRWCLPESVK